MPIGVAAGGERACARFAPFADHLIATEPSADLIGAWHAADGRDRDRAVARAHEQLVRPEDVAANIPCGPDLDAIVESVRPFWDAGYTDVALVQVGDEGVDPFFEQAVEPLLEKLRSAAGG